MIVLCPLHCSCSVSAFQLAVHFLVLTSLLLLYLIAVLCDPLACRQLACLHTVSSSLLMLEAMLEEFTHYYHWSLHLEIAGGITL